jgi:hypothetical protein
MEKLIYDVFGALDKSGTNVKKYKDKFNAMTDVQFEKFFKSLFANDDAYLTLDIVEYDRPLKLEDIYDAADILGIPLLEKLVFPHMSPDPNNPIVTKEPVPVGYLHVKRTQQTVAKKNGLSISTSERSMMTGQLTGHDKNGRNSDLEACAVLSYDMKEVLREMNGARSDDMHMKQQMLQAIQEKGYFSLEELDSDPANKTALNTVDVFFTGMLINTDLVTKGLMNKKTLNEES